MKIIARFGEGWKGLGGRPSGEWMVGKGEKFGKDISNHSRVSRGWPTRSVVGVRLVWIIEVPKNDTDDSSEGIVRKD